MDFDNELLINSELTPAEKKHVTRLHANGKVSRIAPGLYTPLPESDWPELLKTYRLRILASAFPGAVLGYKTACSGIYTGKEVFLNYKSGSTKEYPGFIVYAIKNAGLAEGDRNIGGRDIYFPSEARMLLDNLSIDRSGTHRNADRNLIEERLASICASRGELKLIELRDQAKILAKTLGKEREQKILDGIIGAILNTRQTQTLSNPNARAWQQRVDLQRLKHFDDLIAHLRVFEPKIIQDSLVSYEARRNFAFIESYFSNFIEGTEFEVGVARDIALNDKIVAQRPKDSHDIKGVFDLASNSVSRMSTIPASPACADFLRGMHREMMAARPEVCPGEFKLLPNQAGTTYFVAPELVRGTLIEASKRINEVRAGIHRALYVMFITSEIHPFADGNGRVARLCMNAELTQAAQARILIPILLRDEYMSCLRLLSQEGNPQPFFKLMTEVQGWSSLFNFNDVEQLIIQMDQCNAFRKARDDFKLIGPHGEKFGQFNLIHRH